MICYWCDLPLAPDEMVTPFESGGHTQDGTPVETLTFHIGCAAKIDSITNVVAQQMKKGKGSA